MTKVEKPLRENCAYLVIPCFEEHERLPNFLPCLLRVLEEGGFKGKVQVVDDGSSEFSKNALSELIELQRQEYPQLLAPVLHLEKNQGKGASICFGWLQAPLSAQWLGFVDADGAVPADEVLRSYHALGAMDASQICGLFATRELGAQTRVKRKLWRLVSSVVFSVLVRLRHQTYMSDSQCGLKWISRTCWEKFGAQLQERGFRFDIELIKYLRYFQGELRTFPISWAEAQGSKISFRRALQIFWRALVRPIVVRGDEQQN